MSRHFTLSISVYCCRSCNFNMNSKTINVGMTVSTMVPLSGVYWCPVVTMSLLCVTYEILTLVCHT